ncbi:MAG: pyruvate kinase [Planctomycetes bacterium]|nr:pyruvate kinase [Planctomycetota bacterium]
MRKTKIVATIGPASEKPETLKKMLQAGLDVARINLSHGTFKEHVKRIKMIRDLSRQLKRPVAILADLQGTKIRTGLMQDNKPVNLIPGRSITITTADIPGNEHSISTTYKEFVRDIKVNDRVLLDDGLMQLKVVSKTGTTAECRIIDGGLLKEHKGMNLPDTVISAPSLTEKDKECVKFAAEIKADYIAQSFVRTSENVLALRNELKRRKAYIPIIAKIEKPEAVANLNSILDVVYGIMVARGDLGVEMSVDQIPILQKRIIARANEKDVPVITATQMLESMTVNPRPTRAEVNDVANAVFDGTDAIMLSGETAAGKYPVESVATMSDIAERAEGSEFFTCHERGRFNPINDSTEYSIAHAAYSASIEANAKAMVVFTLSGKTALLLSKRRPCAPIYAITHRLESYNRLNLIWGTIPVLNKFGRHGDEMVRNGIELLKKMRYLKKGDRVVILAGTTATIGGTNFMKIETI